MTIFDFHVDLEYSRVIKIRVWVRALREDIRTSSERSARRWHQMIALVVRQQCSRAGDRVSGSDFGRTAIGKAPKTAFRPAEGRPDGQFRCFPGSSPAKIRPGRPIYGPEALLRNMEYFATGLNMCAKRAGPQPGSMPRLSDGARLAICGAPVGADLAVNVALLWQGSLTF
jgi:hypothetical protein